MDNKEEEKENSLEAHSEDDSKSDPGIENADSPPEKDTEVADTEIDDNFVEEPESEADAEGKSPSAESEEEVKEIEVLESIEIEESAETADSETSDESSKQADSEEAKKKSPLKVLAAVAFALLILVGVIIAIPNALWYYELQAGSKNMEQLNMEQATRDFETAVNIARNFPESDERLGVGLNTLSTVLLAQGRYSEAEKTIKESLEIHQKRYGDDARSTKPLLLMAGLNRRQGNYNEAVKLYEKALKKIAEAEGEKDAYARALMILSVLEIYRGNYDKAESGFKKVETIGKTLYGERYNTSVDMLVNRGRIEEARGKYQSAKRYYRKCLEELGPVNETNKAGRCLVFNLMAELFLIENNNEEAGPLIQKAHALSQSLSAKEYLQAANLETLTNLTTFHIKEGKFDKAEKILEQSIPIARDRLGEGHPAYAKVEMQEAEVLASKGKFKQAKAISDRAMSLVRATVGEEHRFVAEQLRSQAKMHAFAGEKEASEAKYKEALEMFKNCLGKSHPECASTLFGWAAMLETNGNSAKANDLQYKARKIVEVANNR